MKRAIQISNTLALFVLISLGINHHAVGQKQLVLLKHEKVILRLYPGDDLVYSLKNSKEIKSSYVNNLYDTAVVTHSDVVPFYTIDKIYFNNPKFYNRAGAGLFVGGALLFLIDQINVTLVQGKKPSLDRGVSTTTMAMMIAGLPMMLIKKKSQRLNYKYRLMMVKEDSPFYRAEINSVEP